MLRRDEPGGIQTLNETELVLFELAHFLDSFWATEAWVSGTEVTGKLPASVE